MTRSELIQKIITAEEQLPKAGKLHRRDLMKHISRMKRELKTYDYYQKRSGALLDAKASLQSG